MSDEIKEFTPREVVSELDRFIVGQDAAKKAVAIALRNRWRRQKVVPESLQEDILPKNIIMMGPTGCGKTEVARRLAKLANAPFVKVEATKFTEIGYVGRDVDSMVRDLVKTSVEMCKEEALQMVQVKAQKLAEDALLDLLLPNLPSSSDASLHVRSNEDADSKEQMRQMLREGKLDEREVTIHIKAPKGMPVMHMFGQGNMEEMAGNIQEAFESAFSGNGKKKRRLKVPQAMDVLTQQEAQKLLDHDELNQKAIRKAEQSGIIFIDEIDKIAGARGGKSGPDVSREGVQRDILPIVEGSAVTTKYGVVRTEHVLFIAAGAFHISKPSDLIPELQGRFPIRVELDALTERDFIRILTETETSLIKQYIALLATEGVHLEFDESGIVEIARIAAAVNQSQENIGARRLATVLEKLLEEESFFASDRKGSHVVINGQIVKERLASIAKSEDLSQFIL